MSLGFRFVSQNPLEQLCIILSCQHYFLLAETLGFNSLSCRLFHLVGPFSPFPSFSFDHIRIFLVYACVCTCAVPYPTQKLIMCVSLLVWVLHQAAVHSPVTQQSWLMKCLLHSAFITAQQLHIYTQPTHHVVTCKHWNWKCLLHMLI